MARKKEETQDELLRESNLEAENEDTTDPTEAEAADTEIENADAAPDEENITVEDVVKEEMPEVKSKLTAEDAAEFANESSLSDAFFRRSIVVPGRKKRRQAFRDEEQVIGDENGEISTFGSAKKREYEILSDSAKATKPKVLYGRVDGIEEMELGANKIPMAVCHLITDKRADINTENELKSGIYKIVIPAPMFFIYDKEEYATPEGYDSLKKKMDMRVNSIIEFVVYDIDMSEEKVLASRISAMQLIGYDYYLGKNAPIKPGKIAKGYITYVNSRCVIVDVFGAEIAIPYSELSWKYIKNPLDEKNTFYVGAAVPVRIKSVETAKATIYGRNYPYLKVTGSIKDAKENPNKMFFERYVKGQKYHGEVGYRLATGEYIVNLGSRGSGIDGSMATCICKAPSIELGGTPYVGQNCTVAIVGKNEDGYRIAGAFTYLEPRD